MAQPGAASGRNQRGAHALRVGGDGAIGGRAQADAKRVRRAVVGVGVQQVVSGADAGRQLLLPPPGDEVAQAVSLPRGMAAVFQQRYWGSGKIDDVDDKGAWTDGMARFLSWRRVCRWLCQGDQRGRRRKADGLWPTVCRKARAKASGLR